MTTRSSEEIRSDKTKELITQSLNYYDINTEKYSKLYDKFKYYSIITSESDTDHNRIVFYDKNKEIIFKTRYEILGMYNATSNLWIWGWSIPSLQKNELYLSRKILNYGFDVLLNESHFLKSELITSRFRISDTLQLNIHISIASYISKNPMIFRLIYDPDINEKDEKGPFKVLNKLVKNSIAWFLYLLDTESTK